VDGSGTIYVADTGNGVIRKVDASGKITTVAGNNGLSGGYSGDGGAATNAALHSPKGVFVDGSGNLYIADTGNNVIRKVDASGKITTVAGNYSVGGQYGGDGGAATNASLNAPSGMAMDGAGNLYIADSDNQVIRKVDASGMITTVAGGGTSGLGDGGAATNASLAQPLGVAVDGLANIYIADFGSQVIRLVDACGNIATVAGNGANDYTGDGGAATNAALNYPSGVAVDGAGNFYIADTANCVIRKVTGVSGLSTNQNITLTLSNVQTNMAGNYQMMVANVYGSATSSNAALIVGAPPVITLEPVSQFLFLGDTAVFNVAATGVPAPGYQWYFNSAALPGATDAALSLPDISTNNLGDYYVVAANCFGSVTSSVASLTSVQVYAGPNQVITNTTAAIQTTATRLQGVAFDSRGRAAGGSCFVTWSVVSAPVGATVTFANTNLTDSIVTFYEAPSNFGTYWLRLTLSDGQSAQSSDVLVTIMSPNDIPYGGDYGVCGTIHG
jgi:sugar lactone lactonase YvrE